MCRKEGDNVATSWAEANVKCPFYKYDDGKNRIDCEGCTGSRTTRVLFNTKADQKRHLNGFCCGQYKKCPIAEMLNKKYE